MGGEASGCDENTTDVLIESALWDAINIAQTGRKLGINSDARYRFERGVDPAFMVPGLELATRLVLELCGGDAVGERRRRQRLRRRPRRSISRSARSSAWPGSRCRWSKMRRILGHLGFMVAGSGAVVKVAVPSWRADVHGKADIVEEIVRIVGVDKVPMTPFDRGDAPRKPVLTAIQKRTRRAKRALAARGMVEAVTWSFISQDRTPNCSAAASAELALANPIASDLSDMRPSLLPGLIAAAQANADRGFADVALFEVGQMFKGDKPEDQFVAASGVRHGFASAQGHGPALVRLGEARRARRQGRCVRGAGRCRRADAGAAGRARRRRTGCIPAAPAPSRSARRTCSAISASCIRARWKRSTPTAR